MSGVPVEEAGPGGDAERPRRRAARAPRADPVPGGGAEAAPGTGTAVDGAGPDVADAPAAAAPARPPRSRQRAAGGTQGAGQGAGEPGPGTSALETRNEVALVGRVSAEAVERSLPSGDVLVTWRLVVERPPSRRPVPEGVRAVSVDTFDCVAWTAGARRTARSLAAGDVVAVQGSLRRRFWRAGAVAASRCEVEVATIKRLARG